MTTCIRNANWVVEWSGGHQYRREIDVAFDGGHITHVGPDYVGDVDVEIDGKDRMVMPGLVNMHCHPSGEPLKKGFREEFGNPQLWWSPLFDRSFIYHAGVEGQLASAEDALCEMLLSGVTSVVDLSTPYDGWLDLLAASGIRAWATSMFGSAAWHTEDGHSVDYVWDEPAGLQALEDAIDLGQAADSHPSGRLSGMLSPVTVDLCTEELLVNSLEAARDHRWRVHIHASQSLPEFHEMTRRHGVTPVQWLDSIDVLGPDSILAHGMFIDAHSWTKWPTDLDRGLLTESGTGLAHCPVVFSRHGQGVEDIGAYIRRGVQVGIGTDSYPHNVLEEIRTAATLGWMATGNVHSVSTGELFTAATAGSSSILGRDDLGRIEVGAAADIVLVDLSHHSMSPVRDPLRSLIYTAADRAVRDVFVDGQHVVRNGEVTTLDLAGATQRLQAAGEQAERDTASRHFAGRTARQLSPLTFPEIG